MLDNGIAATAFLLTAGVPLIVELGASLDVLFAVLVMRCPHRPAAARVRRHRPRRAARAARLMTALLLAPILAPVAAAIAHLVAGWRRATVTLTVGLGDHGAELRGCAGVSRRVGAQPRAGRAAARRRADASPC